MSDLYNYDGTIPRQGLALPEPIIQQFRKIEQAFNEMDSEALQAYIDALKEMFPDFGTNGGAIFTNYWPLATSAVSLDLDFVDFGTHIIPVGAGGDVTLNFDRWPPNGTKYVTLMFHNAGKGVIRWPATLLWQTRGNVAPVMKENGTDTIVLWRDANYLSVTGANVVFAARAGR